MCAGPYTKGPLPADDQLCVEYASAVRPVTSVAARIVTSHGDYYPPNVLRCEDGRFVCIDFEFACCNYAVEDLGSMLANLDGAERKRAFTEAYLDALGEPRDLVDKVLVDCILDGISGWDFGSRLSCFVLENRCADDVQEVIGFCNDVVSEIRNSSDLCEVAITKGLEAAIAETKTLKSLDKGKFYVEATSSADIRFKSNGELPWTDCIQQALAFERMRALR